jgi:hypothetical protein
MAVTTRITREIENLKKDPRELFLLPPFFTPHTHVCFFLKILFSFQRRASVLCLTKQTSVTST